ncbi:MAG: RidA family protein [Treponemataceae bacterium]
MSEYINTEKAPAAIGPYSQAIVAKGMVYCSGQIPLDPKTQAIVEGGIKEQTQRVLENLKAVLSAAGSSLEKAVKTTVYLSDMADFADMNAIYGQYFTGKPARVTVAVKGLPKSALVEIDCIAEN